MKKRTCGTCGYFQESDMSGCGWCVHPQRRVTTDLKIMVRRGELACRDGWSRDLWAPTTDTPVASEPSLTGPVQPITHEEMTQLVSARYVTLEPTSTNVSSLPVDVVVGESPAPPVNEDRATLLSHDPRAAIEAARKRHLAQLQGNGDELPKESSLNRSGDYSGDRSPFVSSTVANQSEDRPSTPPKPVLPRFLSDVAPVQRSELPPESAALVSFAADEEQFSTVPKLESDLNLPSRPGEQESRVVTSTTFEHDIELAPTRVKAPERWQSDLREQPPAVQEPVVEQVAQVESPEIDEYFEDGLAAETNVEDIWLETEEEYYEPEPVYEPPRKRWQPNLRFERRPRQRAYEETAEAWDDGYIDDHLTEPDYVEQEYLPPDPAFAWNVQDDRIDMTIEASPTVPRMCRTCRDFRPADNGGRGWCTNKWAFSHRRMVDADELPCETSLGCWWLPHDEVWLTEADAASHTEPTPLVDHWLGRRTGVSVATGTRRR